MKAAKVISIVLALFFGGLLLVGCNVYSGYNRAVRMDEEVKSAWAQVENQLQRRFELIPNLVETVKGITRQEESIFLGIAEARTKYFKAATIPDKVEAAGQVQSALARLLVMQETYPDLKSNQSFLKLQDTLEGTENRLAVERMRYNDAVKLLNTYRRQLLGGLYSGLAGVSEAKYFEVEEAAKTAPKVDFSKQP